MNIDFIANCPVFVGGWWVFIWFFVFMALIVICSLSIVKTVEYMAFRTKRIPPIFYTAILLAFATATPELMTGIDSGLLKDPNPIFAYFDNNGSNFMNVFFTCVFTLGFSAFFDYKIYQAIHSRKITQIKFVKNRNAIRHYANVVGRTFNAKDKNNVFIIYILIVLSALLVLASYVPAFGDATIPGLKISAVSILPIGTWTLFLIYLLIKNKGNKEKPVVDENSVLNTMPWILLVLLFFFVLAVLLVVSLLETDIVQGFTNTYHINEIISGGIIMAIATGLPEFVGNFHLYRKQHFNMVLESFVGSLWMNMMLVFFVDVSFRKMGLFGYEHDLLQYQYDQIHNIIPNHLVAPLDSHAVQNADMMGPWNVLGLVLMLFLPVLVTKKVGNNKVLGISVVTGLILAYMIGFSVITGVYWQD